MKECIHSIIPLILSFLLVACGKGLTYTPSNVQTESSDRLGADSSEKNRNDSRNDDLNENTNQNSNENEQENEEVEEQEEEQQQGPTPEEIAQQQEMQAQQALLATGTQAYAQKCAGCHMPLAQSLKRGRTPQQILMSANIMPHMGVQWPAQAEADAIAFALSQ